MNDLLAGLRKGLLSCKPAVHKNVLIFISGGVWIGVGMLLVSYAYRWLVVSEGAGLLIAVLLGIGGGLIIRTFGFIKLVDKNLERIAALDGTPCIFSFMSWKSYLNVMFMVGLGITLRHSSLPKLYLSPVYLGIGSALFLSGFRYFRMLFFPANTPS